MTPATRYLVRLRTGTRKSRYGYTSRLTKSGRPRPKRKSMSTGKGRS